MFWQNEKKKLLRLTARVAEMIDWTCLQRWISSSLVFDGSWQVAEPFCNKAAIFADLGEPQAWQANNFYSGKQRKKADSCSLRPCGNSIKNITLPSKYNHTL